MSTFRLPFAVFDPFRARIVALNGFKVEALSRCNRKQMIYNEAHKYICLDVAVCNLFQIDVIYRIFTLTVTQLKRKTSATVYA